MKKLSPKDKRLFERAKNILKQNRVGLSYGGGFTKPSQAMYPFQWNWDAGFIAYGYTHFDPDKAVEELHALFRGQWRNGFLPHIVFHGRANDYFPGPYFWQSRSLSGVAARGVATSGLTQPPIHALVLWHVYKELTDEKSKKRILKEFFPKLFRLHRYLLSQRDPEGWGLVTIYHPWESGFDNSPRWDSPLSRIKVSPGVPGSYHRYDLKIVKDSAYRPTNEDYDKYVTLALLLKRRNYKDELIYSSHPFKVKDKVFSSILYLANLRLKKMAEILKEDTSLIDTWLKRFEESLFTKLWSEEKRYFCDYDLNQSDQIKVKTVGAVLPLITGLLSAEQLKAMADHLDHATHVNGKRLAFGLVPSIGIQEKYFQAVTYWRGPIWFNINWLLWKGFIASGLLKQAEYLRQDMIKFVRKNGFYEYYNPLTGEGIGARNFSWTAALTIDLLSSHAPEPEKL